MDEMEILEALDYDYESIQEQRTEALEELLERRDMKQLKTRMEELNEFDVAEFLSEIEDNRMPMVFRLLSKSTAADVFANLDTPDQERIINSVTDSELAALVEELYVDDAVDMMEELPANVVARVMRTATPSTRNLINQYLRFPEDSAGSIMTSEFVDLKKYMSVKESIARIRRIGADKETIYVCFVTTMDRKLEGIVTVKDLLLAPKDLIIRDIMETNLIYVTTQTDQEEVAALFDKYDFLAIPVVDNEMRLVGIVTIDDAIDVIQEEATEDIEMMAAITPTDRPYMKTGVIETWKKRIPWLMILMISSTLTGSIIASFEDALAATVVLTGFIPMLMGTGGNAAGQSSVSIIRGLSLGEIEYRDVPAIIWKEFRVAFLCGIALGVVNFAKLLLWDRLALPVALVVCSAMVVTVIMAKVVGCSLPVLAKRVGFDPAVMANPFITTIVDALSLLIYFKIACAVLHIG